MLALTTNDMVWAATGGPNGGDGMRTLTRDELVAAVTAFADFADMERAMRAGYVPTLRGVAVAGASRSLANRQRRWNEKVNRLRAEVLKAGYRYFAKGKVVGG